MKTQGFPSPRCSSLLFGYTAQISKKLHVSRVCPGGCHRRCLDTVADSSPQEEEGLGLEQCWTADSTFSSLLTRPSPQQAASLVLRVKLYGFGASVPTEVGSGRIRCHTSAQPPAHSTSITGRCLPPEPTLLPSTLGALLTPTLSALPSFPGNTQNCSVLYSTENRKEERGH